jgi:adenylate cyclase
MADPAAPIERKLAAIFAADVAGYSRLMGQDEVGTMRTLASHREIMDRLIAEHRGRIANTAGDSVLAEFPSVIDAVTCAVEVQKALGEANEGVPEDRRMSFRIGVHVGDVIVRGADLLGDGINVAARLQGIAEPGGVCISGEAHRYTWKALPLAYVDVGHQIVRHIEEPIRVYRIGSPSEQPSEASAPEPVGRTLPLPTKPSIAVLPFANMSGDPEQEYFADGIAEDIITALSSLRWLFVIARNSSFTYKGRTVDVKQVGRELGVRYVLEGSVRRLANRVRIAVQLIDAATGGHHWTERYDRDLVDIFVLQDEIANSVAGAIEPRLLAAEGVRSLGRSAEDLGAWELVAQALAHFWRVTRGDSERAIALLTQASDEYPDYPPAHSLLAFCHSFASHMGWADRTESLSKSRLHSRKAVQLDPTDSWAHLALGYEALMENRLNESISGFRRAIELNPNSAQAHSHLGRALAFSGRDREAMVEAEQSIRLSPRDPQLPLFTATVGLAHCVGGRYEEAISVFREALKALPGHQGAQRSFCVSLAHTGRLQEAREVLSVITRDQPNFCVAWVKQNLPFVDSFMERFVEGLRKAGLPE